MESELHGPAGEGVALTQEARQLGLAGARREGRAAPWGCQGVGAPRAVLIFHTC